MKMFRWRIWGIRLVIVMAIVTLSGPVGAQNLPEIHVARVDGQTGPVSPGEIVATVEISFTVDPAINDGNIRIPYQLSDGLEFIKDTEASDDFRLIDQSPERYWLKETGGQTEDAINGIITVDVLVKPDTGPGPELLIATIEVGPEGDPVGSQYSQVELPTATAAAPATATVAASATATVAASATATVAASATATVAASATPTVAASATPTVAASATATVKSEGPEATKPGEESDDSGRIDLSNLDFTTIALGAALLLLLLAVIIFILSRRRTPVVVPPLAPSAAYLRLVADGRDFAITESPFSIGRAEDNSLTIDETFPQWQTISRNHARITEHPMGYVIEDKGSRNGIKVQGRATLKNLLKSGWRIDIGGVEFTFYQGVEPGEQS